MQEQNRRLSHQYKTESFYLLPRLDEEERLLLLFEVADPRDEELLLRCTLDLFELFERFTLLEELLRERLTCAGALLRWLVCCTLREGVDC